MEEIYAKFIKTKDISFKYAKGMRDIFGKEIHTYHEIFFFIGGEAEFISEVGKEKLVPNTTVIIPKETFHQFVVRGSETEYHRCVFNFDVVAELEELIAKKFDKIMLIQDEAMTELFGKMIDLTENPLGQPETAILMKALFAQILVNIDDEPNHALEHSALNTITKEALAFINRYPDQNLTVAYLADSLHISSSHLAHVFKRDLHISIHKYILEKRLILANKKIKNSVNPTQAAAECGFHDYSGFYRQYKKMFGLSPAAVFGQQSCAEAPGQNNVFPSSQFDT